MKKSIYSKVVKAKPLPSREDFAKSLGRTQNKEVHADLYRDIVEEVKKTYFLDVDSLPSTLSFSPPKGFDLEGSIKKKILSKVPQLSLFLKNVHPSGISQVIAASYFKGTDISFYNLSELKLFLRKIHDQRWTRNLNKSEEQGSVSVLGSISEELLKAALDDLTEHPDVFRTSQDDTKSYGDFVLLAMPNNLWFSVKSGYSRERLLASGFSNDLVGVGFFEDYSEFTSRYKVRNFKKVGFLAIYLPDTAVNNEQEKLKTSTYMQVEDYYKLKQLPLNINGKPFFRKLSSLGDDIDEMLKRDVEKRSTITF